MSLTPLLLCRDLDQTRDFYRHMLHFHTTETGEGTLTVAKDGGQLVFTRENLWQHAPVLTGTLYFTLDDVDAYHALIRGKVELAWDLEETEYGSREFGLMDCNGYCLAFQQRRVDKP